MPRIDLLKKLKACAEENDKIIPWGELKTDTFFEIISVSNGFENKFGESRILTLEDLETDKRVRVFSTSCLPVQDFLNDKKQHFIMPKGLKPCDGGKKNFYDYKYLTEDK